MSGFVTAACCSCGSTHARRRRWCRRSRPSLRSVQEHLPARNLRQHKDGSGDEPSMGISSSGARSISTRSKFRSILSITSGDSQTRSESTFTSASRLSKNTITSDTKESTSIRRAGCSVNFCCTGRETLRQMGPPLYPTRRRRVYKNPSIPHGRSKCRWSSEMAHKP
jgi:hypothetical protein